MGRRGPAPLPTAVKRMRGNPGKRALNDDEPELPARPPRCPAHLTGEARAEWRRVARTLSAAGLLTQVDRAALAIYCQAWSRWVKAEEQVARHGEIMKTASGNLIQNPYLAIANRAMKQLQTLAREFGMTPSARSQLHIGLGDGQPRTLADELFRLIGED